MPTLSVVIPVHNKWELTAACLRSLAEHTPGGDVAVIVVDNASADDTSGACPALGSSLFGRRFRYRRFENNRNFGPACNAGAALADSDLLFFLNNDTLLTPGWLPPLQDALAAEPDLVGVGPLLAYPDDTVQHLGIVITPAGGSIGHLYAGLPLAHPLARRRRRFPAIPGAARMVSRALFLEAGGFCEAYVNGFEDVDFCLALAENGGVMSVIPESRVIHFESQTPQRRDHDEDNGRLLRARRDLSRFVNMPALAEEDDYVLRVEPDLQVRFGVPEERRKALLRRRRRELRFVHTVLAASDKGKRLRGWSVRQIDALVCAGTDVAALARAGGVEDTKIRVILPAARPPLPAGVPVGSVGGRSNDRFIFVAAGPLNPAADHASLLQAMACVQTMSIDDLPEWEVRIVGEGPLFGALLDSAEKLGVRDRLSLIGGQDRRVFLDAADAAVCCDVAGRNGVSVMLDAWNLGVPVACTTLEAHRDLGEDKISVLFSPPTNPVALAGSMLRLMQESALRERLVAGGRAALERFRPVRLGAEYAALYDELLNAEPGASAVSSADC